MPADGGFPGTRTSTTVSLRVFLLVGSPRRGLGETDPRWAGVRTLGTAEVAEEGACGCGPGGRGHIRRESVFRVPEPPVQGIGKSVLDRRAFWGSCVVLGRPGPADVAVGAYQEGVDDGSGHRRQLGRPDRVDLVGPRLGHGGVAVVFRQEKAFARARQHARAYGRAVRRQLDNVILRGRVPRWCGAGPRMGRTATADRDRSTSWPGPTRRAVMEWARWPPKPRGRRPTPAVRSFGGQVVLSGTPHSSSSAGRASRPRRTYGMTPPWRK